MPHRSPPLDNNLEFHTTSTDHANLCLPPHYSTAVGRLEENLVKRRPRQEKCLIRSAPHPTLVVAHAP